MFIKKINSNDKILGNKNSIPSLIETFRIKQDVKNSLKILYKNFKNEIFGNIDLQKKLNINKNTATSYIKILNDHNLIESVTGYGKGKYRFK